MIQVDDVQVRENLTIEASPLRVEDHEVKHFRGKKIVLMNVVWGGPVGGSTTWELESQMRDLYLALFTSSNFLGRKFSKWGRVVTPQNLINLFN